MVAGSSETTSKVGAARTFRWWLVLAATTVALLLFLSWFHVLPGGWRLRSLFGDPTQEAKDEYAAYVRERLAAFSAENPRITSPRVVFLGSSTIERFPLRDLFPPDRVLNRGIGSETADELLGRLPQRLPTTPPSGVVIYSGSVDHHREGRRPAVIVASLDAVVRALRATAPDAPILLLGVLSQRDCSAEAVRARAALDAALEKFSDRENLDFLPLARPPLVDEAGRLTEALTVDRYHLSKRGYAVVAQWILDEGGAVGRLLRR